MSLVSNFISKVQSTYATGSATEHSYRSAFEELFAGLGVKALNEPKRIRCGAPDFEIRRSNVTGPLKQTNSTDGARHDLALGYVEVKDLHVPIRKMKDANRDQQKRYVEALPNLIYSNGLDWDFYVDGKCESSVSIGRLDDGNLVPEPDQYDVLEHLLANFVNQRPQTITSPRDLAQRMAGKALLIKDVLTKTLQDEDAANNDLMLQYNAFQEHLIHGISIPEFADVYAETIAYGMFAARLHDATLDTFSRQEALQLLPKSNPFLRSLFGYIAGMDLDDRIAWIVDDLAAVFQACDVGKLMEGFGKLTGQTDPFLHFYETFLAAYNPAKRKARGVWYTPEPVVNFIVRAVDEVLQTEFGFPDGLADTSKITIDWDTGQPGKGGKPKTIKKEVHRVQILDPATGTGTFLAEVIKQIAPRIKAVAPGMWTQYIEADLIPRLHGFELLMASYAMCHIKLDMILTELGYQPSKEAPRLSVYLTNSLEEGEPANQVLPFSQWLSREALGANTIKRDMPIMCVVGNPPYLGEGGTSDDWIGSLMDDYKKEPGGKVKLKERNSKWINDLYVKFLRLSSHLIERNGEGVLGFITNHGYLDNPTFRGMRWHLLKTFDKIWIVDLHGNAKKKELTADGKSDKNVFDIQQGVSIVIAIKTKTSTPKKLAQVLHKDIWGSRLDKYKVLRELGPYCRSFSVLEIDQPHYFFRPWDYSRDRLWNAGFSLDSFVELKSNGIVTANDSVLIADSPEQLRRQVEARFGRYDSVFEERISYRPFEMSYIYNDPAIVERCRGKVMVHYRQRPQLGLLFSKQVRDANYAHAFVTAYVSEAIFLSGTTATNAMNAPLYLYAEDTEIMQEQRVNFAPKPYARLRASATNPQHGEPDELAVFDYIYGVLYCPGYRKAYAEFLKIDYPRIPWPTTPDEFWHVAEKGTQLRKLHLMDPSTVGPTPFPFMGEGHAVVENPAKRDGKIWINTTQYFDAVPEVSWEFYIGGYQPAQKWLKDRKGRTLTFDDIRHYQRILKILSETDRIMKTITMNLDD